MTESLERNKKGIFFMICSAACACAGQLLWKLSTQNGPFLALAGFALYGLGALLMLTSYKYGKLSVLQPMQSINYVLSIVIGALVLGEAVTGKKVIGVAIIMAGIVLIGGGDRE